jgi:GH25 family lysozyme M1 (1,4-beta-N-acetylmuramidase)
MGWRRGGATSTGATAPALRPTSAMVTIVVTMTLLADLLVAVPSRAAAALAAPPPGYSVTGVDVSNHQGTIDWAQVAASGQRFAYAKATEGVHFVDPYYAANYAGAKLNGLYVGGYHFARPDRSDGAAQADFFLDRSGYLNDGHTLPPMLDIEWPWEGSGSPYPCYGLTPDQLVTWIRAFVNRILERTGRPTTIYTNVNWWNPCTASNTSFGNQPLVVARYASTPGILPAGWSRFAFWQYTSSASIPGIIGGVDHNVFNGSLADLAQLASGTMFPWGLPGDVPLVGDYNGDGRDDFVIWRPTTGTWWVAYSSGGGTKIQWGLPGDVPLTGNVGGDGRDDFVVWRPSTGTWWATYSGGGSRVLQWGLPRDVPLTDDYNNDGRDDFVIWRPTTGTWWVAYSSGGSTKIQWGLPGDVPLAGDFNNDGRDDFIVWRPSTGTWWTTYSSGGSRVLQWGLPGDVPLTGDYSNDTRDEFVVWRPTGEWWIHSDG